MHLCIYFVYFSYILLWFFNAHVNVYLCVCVYTYICTYMYIHHQVVHLFTFLLLLTIFSFCFPLKLSRENDKLESNSLLGMHKRPIKLILILILMEVHEFGLSK